VAAGRRGSVVTLLCDDGRRYSRSYYNDDWVTERGWDLAPYTAMLELFMVDGRWPS
jgi:cysteine synthase A